MTRLEEARKNALYNLNLFGKLQKARNMDFPSNLNYFYKQNYSIFTKYFDNTVCNLKYNLKTDYTIRVLIYNFVASVKAYLNRKQKRLNSIIPSEYKDKIYAIFKKHWKASRNETSLDKLIYIRDIFEHEEISNISLVRIIWQDHIDYHLKYHDLDLLEICSKSIDELDSMNKEIERFVEIELSKLNLRDNSLFMNLFYKKFKGKNYTQLIPESTEDETKYFDNLIENLIVIKKVN